MPWLIGAAAAAALVASAAAFGGLWRASNPPPFYHQLTFRRGFVSAARFAPDGRTIMYSAAWEGAPVGLFSTRVDSPESSSLPLASADLLSISSSGRMAIRLRDGQGGLGIGTLAEMPIAGQAPRQLLTDVEDADWAPDGEALVVSHRVQGRTRLEYPAGTVLYDPGLGRPIRYPRFSPKGGLIAFTDVTATDFGGGSQIAVVDLTGHVKVLSQGWGDVFGLAWAAGGNEIWFSAREAAARSGGLVLHAVNLSGRHRVVARTPGLLVIAQVWRDGRVLLRHENWPATLICQAPGSTSERDLSWLDFSRARDISADGRFVLFGEDGLAEGAKAGVYLRKTDGSPAIRLGDGKAIALSPDGASAIVIDRESPTQLTILPTGPGQARVVRGGSLTYLSASWFPDGAHLLCGGQEPGRSPALYVQDVAGGVPRRIVDGADRGVVSPDGRTVASIAPDNSVALTPIDGGRPRVVRGLPPVTSVLRWADTGHHLFLRGALSEQPTKIFRLDLETGRADLWRTLGPTDLSGVRVSIDISLTPDGRSYCYSYIRNLSSVFVVDGLK
jgi:dipeptidyl aminopeptidase/acylaminoacyl peptidase